MKNCPVYPKSDWLEVMHSFGLWISFALSFYIVVLVRFLNLLAHTRESIYAPHPPVYYVVCHLSVFKDMVCISCR